MPLVRVKESDSFEIALKRFKKQCEKEGILSEVKKREHYEKPSIKRKKKVSCCPQESGQKSAGGGPLMNTIQTSRGNVETALTVVRI